MTKGVPHVCLASDILSTNSNISATFLRVSTPVNKSLHVGVMVNIIFYASVLTQDTLHIHILTKSLHGPNNMGVLMIDISCLRLLNVYHTVIYL